MIKSKTQILFIHGGMTFKSHKDYLNFLRTRDISIEKKIRWFDDYLDKKLGANFEVIRPKMPLADNAQYEEWKINFERHFPFLRNNLILIGTSLGGIFLAKYLSENKFPKKIKAVYLIAPPYDNTLPGEDLVGGFKLKADLSLIEKNCKNINLLFSEKDDVIPVAHAYKYYNQLKLANLIVFYNIKGHFKVAKFPEIIKLIKRDIQKK